MSFADFRASLARNASGPFRNPTKGFGEVVEYFPAAGGPSRSIRVHATREKTDAAETEVATIENDRLWVKADRDPTNGIAEPRLGDAIRRADDQPDHRWGYAGQVKHETASTWYLLFTRERPTRYR